MLGEPGGVSGNGPAGSTGQKMCEGCPKCWGLRVLCLRGVTEHPELEGTHRDH